MSDAEAAPTGPPPARLPRLGLNGLNFFLAAAQTGFGPFVTVYLTGIGWSQTGIGFALTLGTVAAIATQMPGGALVDALHGKRLVTAAALAVTAVSALMLAAWPRPGPGFVAQIWSAQMIHAAAASVLTPAVAALTLALCGHAGFSAQLGGNARWASLGSAAAAALLGAFATWQSNRAVLLVTAALIVPALVALAAIRSAPEDPRQPAPVADHPALLPPGERPARPWHIFRELHLHTFAVCVLLFHLANAAMLPLALNVLAARGAGSGFVVSAAVIVPQGLVAAASPWIGRAAQRYGRRPLLLAGFAALPLRALLFATLPGGPALIAIELLDGISGAVFGIMLPLIAADLTRNTGYFNLAIGSLGLAVSTGAAISTLLAGWIADAAGAPAAFLTLAATGAAAVTLLAIAMPETRPPAGDRAGGG